MSLYLLNTSRLRSTERTGQSTISDEALAKQQSPHIVSIHILDDDSLLNIFYLYRPFFLCRGENNHERLYRGDEPWVQGRWWYGLAHVCQRWRNLTLGAVSYLGLSLVCVNGTPVANMLEDSPPLPLTVDYGSENGITAEDEEGMMLALQQRDRIRHLRLRFPVRDLQKLVMAIDGEFPILEYLIVSPLAKGSTILMLPETLQAPHLRHLSLSGFACPIQPRLHPTAASLVTLDLAINHPSAYFQPNALLRWISFIPQLENLAITFSFPVPNRDVERQPTHTPITTHITLPNLRLFRFQGVSAYLEAVICRITAPRLENLQIQFFKQLTFSVPRLVQFMDTTENVRFDNAVIRFKGKQIDVAMHSRVAITYFFCATVDCWHLDWQVSSVAQISNALSQVFSAVEHLALQHEVHNKSSEEHNDVHRIEWRNLLSSFSNVKTLHVEDGLVEGLSRCLQLEDGELPLELLPELQELTYFGSRYTGDALTSFIDARQNAGRPVTVKLASVVLRTCPFPECKQEYSRVQELERHIWWRHLPPHLYCEQPGCDLTWSRPYLLKSHRANKHPGVPMPEQDGFMIYDAKVLAKQVRTREIGIKQAVQEACSLFEEKAKQTGKLGIWRWTDGPGRL